MVGFDVKKISKKQSVGKKLRALREANFYTTKRLAKKLLIHEKYVTAIENDFYDGLPDATSAKNFIKSYAKFLKKDPAPYLNQFLAEAPQQCTPQQKNISIHKKKEPNKIRYWVTVNLARNIFITALMVIFIFYISLEIKKIITPPNLIITTPQDELVVKNPIIKIIGKTEKEARLKINGEIVTPHADGSFNEELDLQRGLNIIKISASKKYSKENIIYRKIIFEEGIVLK